MPERAESKNPKRCGCTGVRWCAYCIDAAFRDRYKMDPPLELPAILVDPDPDREGVFRFDARTQSAPGCRDFSGVYVLHDFLSEASEAALLSTIEETAFVPAQSGKEKQHYGPKINFNKKRINADAFRGLPPYLAPIERRLTTEFERAVRAAPVDEAQTQRALSALARFETTDLFVLRYHAEQASNLDLHLDDTFAYGEAIFDISLESDSVMTFYRRVARAGEPDAEACVLVSLPARSAIVLTGEARLSWEHGILARDIVGRRTSITLRTLSDVLRESDAGRRVREIAGASSATN